jgi:hypothetical protein
MSLRCRHDTRAVSERAAQLDLVGELLTTDHRVTPDKDPQALPIHPKKSDLERGADGPPRAGGADNALGENFFRCVIPSRCVPLCLTVSRCVSLVLPVYIL